MISTVLEALRTKVEALDLQLAGQPVPVYARKVPRHQTGVHPVTQITVYELTPEAHTRLTIRHDLYTYRAQVAILSPGNDNVVANMATYSSWRLAILAAFSQKPADLMGLDSLRDVHSEPASWLPVGLIAEGWDVTAVDVTVAIVRTRP